MTSLSSWPLVAVAGVLASCGSYEGAVAIVAPLDGAIVTGLTSVRLVATSSVPVRGVEIDVDDRRVDTDLELPYLGEIDTTALVDGSHHVGVTSVTTEQAHHDTVSVIVDNQPPAVELLSPRDGDRIGDVLVVDVEIDEPAGDVFVVVYVDTKIVATLERPPYRVSLAAATLPDLGDANRALLVAVTSPAGHRSYANANFEVE